MNRQELLQRVRSEAASYGAKTRLARALGYSRQAIHAKLHRDNGLTDDELRHAAQELGIVDPEELDAAEKRLDQIEAALKAEHDLEFPLTPEIRRHRADLDKMHQDTIRISRRDDLPDEVRARADHILSAFGDAAADQRIEQRYHTVAANMHRAVATYQDIVAKVGYTPPRMTGIILRDALFTGDLSPEKLRDILTAMKYDAKEGNDL